MGKMQTYLMLFATFLVIGLIQEIIIRFIMRSHNTIHAKIIFVMVCIGIVFIILTDVVKPHIKSLVSHVYRALRIKETGIMGKWLAYVIMFIIIYVLYYLIFYKNII